MTTSQQFSIKVADGKKKFFSQQKPSEDPLSMRPFTQETVVDSRIRTHSFIVSANKKSKLASGEESHYFIHLEDEGKTIFFPFYFEVKLPAEAFSCLEPENLLTEEKLQEFSSNCIKSWVKSFLKTLP